MSKTNFGRSVTISLLALVLLSSSAHADSSSGKKDSPSKGMKSTTSPTLTSIWLVPTAANGKNVLIQAGRTVPLKFKIAVSGAFLNSTNLIQVSLQALSNCTNSALNSGSPTVLIPPTLAITASPTVSSSTSTSGSVNSTTQNDTNQLLRIENSVFIFNWKVPKMQAIGCYKIIAQHNSAIISSPTFEVRGKK